MAHWNNFWAYFLYRSLTSLTFPLVNRTCFWLKIIKFKNLKKNQHDQFFQHPIIIIDDDNNDFQFLGQQNSYVLCVFNISCLKTYKILDGKLYLFYNQYGVNTLKKWNKEETNLKQAADKYWSELVAKDNM